MTVVYWLGQSFGCTAALWQKPSGTVAVVATQPTTQTAEVPTEAPADDAVVTTVPPQDEKVGMYESREQVDETEPSLRGIDRSHWEPIKTSAAYGTVRHHPIYLRDCRIPDDDQPIDLDQPEGEKLRAALAGAKASGWSRTNVKSTLANPPKFAFDVLTLPIKFIRTPGWEEQYSP